tara:strand:+ start:65003 stop:66259 length:1257 start_codon:yes stop_codon:yes gene_type:complete
MTRRDLYDLVWSKPMTALAGEFDISDRGLAKLCARHHIPVPPRGYWAKVAAGEKPTVPPFLELKDRTLDQVTIRGGTSNLPESVAEFARKRKAERENRVATIRQVADTPLVPVECPHKTVAKTAKFLRTRKPNKEGVLRATEPGHCGVIISAPSAERSIVILDALARGLEEVGLILTAEGDKMSVQRNSDRVKFTLLERTKRMKYVPTPEEVAREERRKEKEARSWRRNDWDGISFGSRPPWPEYVTEWTAQLVFSIDAWADGLRKTWGDGKTQRVERMVPDIVAGIELVLETVRVRREESEERERRWQELQRRRKLAHARKEREEKRLVHLDRIVKLRREAREIRDWLASLPDDAKPSEDNDLGRMLIWVGQRLGEIDRQTGIEAARSFAGTGDLFPEIDELQDPLGDPPERNGWYY